MKNQKILLIASGLAILSGCDKVADLGKKLDVVDELKTAQYKPSGYNSHFTFKGNSFSEYVADTTSKVRAARQKVKGANSSETVIKGNSPYEIIPSNAVPGTTKKYRDAVVVIHGLKGSPYEMRELSQFFARRGMVVRNILLTGHGTVPGDLLKARYKDWNELVEFAVKDTLKIADNVHIAAYSTGGGLAIEKSYKHHIKSLILFSPMVEINSSVEFLLPSVSLVGKAFSSVRWKEKNDEINPYGYSSLPYVSISQVYSLQKKIKRLRDKSISKLPIFVAAPMDDVTVDAKTTIDFVKKNKNPDSKMILYARSNPEISDPRIKVINAKIPSQKILSMSHVGVVSSPSNIIYGRFGKVKRCTIYNDIPEKLKECYDPKSNNVYYGEKNLIKDGDKRVIRRITFNPFFNSMLDDLNKFLNSIK